MVNHDSGGNVLGRWTHQISDVSSLSLQAYYDHFRQEQVGPAETQDAYDLDAQHRFPIGERNDIIWGLGYHYMPPFSAQFLFDLDAAEQKAIYTARLFRTRSL